jgi:hypothetical protein
MSDADLEDKFRHLAGPVVGADRVQALIDAAWRIGDAADVRTLTALARPQA